MKVKEKVELSSKIADIVYKKMVILLAVVGGSGSYAIRSDGVLQVALFFVAGIFKSRIGYQLL
jgi:hypothetical protein